MAKFYLCSLLFIFTLLVENSSSNNPFTPKNEGSYLDPEIKKFCPEKDTMYIKGNYVKISDFVQINGDIYNLCSYRTHLRYIYVFSYNTLAIDMDVDVLGSHLKLIFIAPTWVVVGNRKISVDGSKGDYIPKAEEGNETNTVGEDGKPGLPGGPGGNFFGVADSFVNGRSLTITANGGLGGTGQYGGNGYSPNQGRYVDTNALGKIWCGLYYDICRGTDKQYQLQLQDNHGNFSDFHCKGLYERENMGRCAYRIFGWEGEDGGKGGNGGRGGIGGLPGSIKLLDLSNSTHIATYSIHGVYGEDGVGGIGGRSGQNGHNIIYEDDFFLAPPKIIIDPEQEYDYRIGPNGTDGLNTAGYIDVPIKADTFETSEIATIINDYKKWLRESCVYVQNHSYFVTFYKHLEENSYVRSLYNTSEFLSEVQSIDIEFSKLKSTVDFLPFYESLLGRIYFYVETYKNDTERKEDRNILCLLYTEILGRIYSFNEHAETYLVMQIPQYLELVKENLQKVGQLVEENSTFSTIVEKVNELNKYKENYESQVYKLITKARQYVDNKLINETEDFVKDETKKMSKLVIDIIRFKERPLNYEQELLRWGKLLQDSLVIRSNIYSIRLINIMFDVLSDFLEVVNSVVEVGAEVPEVLRLERNNSQPTNVSLVAFEKLYNKTTAIRIEEVTEISGLLQNILNITRKVPDILFDLTEDVLIVSKKLHSYTRFLTMNALRSDLLKTVQIKRDELSTINSLRSSDSANAEAHEHISNSRLAFTELSRIIKITTFSRGFLDVYNEYKYKNVTELDAINDYIYKAYSELYIEKSHEDSIYMIVYQLLQRIEDEILSVLDNPHTVSNIAVEVSNWNLPLILNSIKQTSQQFKGSHQGGHIMSIIENVGGACSVFNGVFFRLQNYLQQKQLENHVADANYAINQGMTFTDAEFAKKYETIKKAFGSNLVLQHYKKAADTFKQYVFPLANFYFQDIILPSHFNIYDDIANTVSVAVTQIDIMLTKVYEYKESMLNGDGIMGRKDFGGRNFNSPNSFFVWKNEQYKDMIAQLLSGNEVTVNAEISKSGISDQAIKFNRIDFYFTSNNKSVQEQINSVLADYEIDVVHLGNSHYRYGDETFLISSDSLEIIYCFENNEETGLPGKVGGAYDYIMNVDISLSPFALWKIYLIPLWEEVTFDSLSVFKDVVDLELGGNGYYISKNKIPSLDLKVNKFYKPQDKYGG